MQKQLPGRCREYLSFVKKRMSCSFCNRIDGTSVKMVSSDGSLVTVKKGKISFTAVDPHHHGPRGEKGTGTKVSDFYTIPLCPRCHRYVHDGEWRRLFATKEVMDEYVAKVQLEIISEWAGNKKVDISAAFCYTGVINIVKKAVEILQEKQCHP